MLLTIRTCGRGQPKPDVQDLQILPEHSLFTALAQTEMVVHPFKLRPVHLQ